MPVPDTIEYILCSVFLIARHAVRTLVAESFLYVKNVLLLPREHNNWTPADVRYTENAKKGVSRSSAFLGRHTHFAVLFGW